MQEYVFNDASYTNVHGKTQGTSYRIVYENRGIGNLSIEVNAILKELEKSLSVYDPKSIISCINRNEDVEVDFYFEEVFNIAKQINSMTEGTFDISAEPLFRAWGFSSTTKNMPKLSDIQDMKKNMGMDKIWIENKKICKSNPNIILNTNAIAKGYSVDLIAYLLDSFNINNYLVEIGGELRLKGKNQLNEIWKVGIDTPKEGNFMPGEDIMAILQVTDKAIATSGNYRQYYVEAGQKIVHTIDPRTGHPINHDLVSVTVLAPEAIVADAFATAFLVAGIEKSIEWINKFDNLDAVFICKVDDDFCVHYSSGAEEYIKPVV